MPNLLFDNFGWDVIRQLIAIYKNGENNFN